MQQFMKERKIEIAMITEPIHIPERNWIGSTDKGAAICWNPGIRVRIRECFKGKEYVAIDTGKLVLISCYITPKASLGEFSEVLRNLEDDMKLVDKEKDIILCGDFNAHNKRWGSRHTSCKGHRLLEWSEENNLIVVNEGDSPTCIRPQGVSWIDLTWATPTAARRIRDWRVETEELSLSDHCYVTFSIGIVGEEGRGPGWNGGSVRERRDGGDKCVRWKMDTLDQEVYDQVLEWKCNERSVEEDVEKEAEWIHRTMMEAADTAMQRARKRTDKRQVYWWSEDISEARKECMKNRRRWTREKTKKRKREERQGAGNITDACLLRGLEKRYKSSKKIVVRAIGKAKEKAWQELIEEIDNDQWGMPYKVVMNKLRTTGPGITETLGAELLERLIFKLFPRENADVRPGEVRIEGWEEEWNVSTEEMCNAIRKKRKNTAPGPDGITMRMLRKIPGRMVEELAKIASRMMKEGRFPRKWKVAKLVLIPKAAKGVESEIPKARPICLIDDIGKCLERIIVERIESWMERMALRGLSFGSIANNQYGFRKNRSTIDALGKVKEIAQEAIRNGETAVIISLDIENAFNSIPWAEIRRMLVRKRVPKYLRRILFDYFKDRYVEFPVKDGSRNRIEVQRGVPQGSVLGPLIWLMVYDKVLRLKRERGCEVLGYADDTIITSVSATYEDAKTRACIQAERTIHTISKLGLKVAVEKTEVMAFQGRRGKRPPKEDSVCLNGKEIKVAKSLKYLGVILDEK